MHMYTQDYVKANTWALTMWKFDTYILPCDQYVYNTPCTIYRAADCIPSWPPVTSRYIAKKVLFFKMIVSPEPIDSDDTLQS